ncbi:molecular chaperone HtpG [Ferrimonas balearica]|uniref:molecular chaperone HtpG n=1 Tax=Ferrimonas balearica TaxID=44012 RepID=UPI001C998D6A|nr:molecular chaperone HtpG [Ferrimonas balearica]MBY5921136.1 molecular chaperone HtpG [Ferrimonas balearica]MBY5996179.1 molecular chaperone HtpG [Ferrimonas balearica]
MSAQTETHGFQTEVSQLLKLVTHSLYSNKEIFLRELVSNAADAADKLRYKALENADLYEGDGQLRVRLVVDKDAGTLSVIDNGIGMTRDEVIEHLGTIAKSGTADFFSQLSGDAAKDSQLIGQFGVGFYSAFIVADRVTVRSRAAGHGPDAGVEWISAGEGDFTVTNIDKPQRGTEIILHLRDEDNEFLDEWRLKQIITKYSDHISIPVEMWEEGTPEREEDGETIAATEGQWNAINKATALWTLAKSEISDDEYKAFYKHVAHDWDDPLIWAHNKVEGKQEYTSLLYIPSSAPFDLWNRDNQHGLKLYVQRVFIMDEAKQFLPQYLRFVKGLVDSNDLPLNVSREILQDSKVTQSLRTALTKRALGMLSKLAKDEEAYQTFWNQFGTVLKEGPAEDMGNKEAIAKLLRFASTHTDEAAATVSLEQYVERMKAGQDKIYYIVADSFNAAKNSPHLELLRKKGIEVLLLSERIDEWLMSHLTEFDGKPLVSVTRGDLGLDDLSDEEKAEQEKQEEASKPLLERFESSLGEKVKAVKVSHRLTDTPACIVADEHDMSSQMIKLMQAAGQPVPEVKPVFELNLEHPLVMKLADEQDDARFDSWAQLLLSQATLAERGSLEDPSEFVSQLNALWLELSR